MENNDMVALADALHETRRKLHQTEMKLQMALEAHRRQLIYRRKKLDEMAAILRDLRGVPE